MFQHATKCKVVHLGLASFNHAGPHAWGLVVLEPTVDAKFLLDLRMLEHRRTIALTLGYKVRTGGSRRIASIRLAHIPTEFDPQGCQQ